MKFTILLLLIVAPLYVAATVRTPTEIDENKNLETGMSTYDDVKKPDSGSVKNAGPSEKKGMHGRQAQEAVKAGNFEVEGEELKKKQKSF